MTNRTWLAGSVALAAPLFGLLVLAPAPACAPAFPLGNPVVNADQTVVIIWDAETKTEHFIRQASFKSDAADFGFLVPTPGQPELSESGDDAFPFLKTLTAPDVKKVHGESAGLGCGCGMAASRDLVGEEAPLAHGVNVLDEKLVAGFNAAVLETASADALVGWLKDHGYGFSPEVQEWARPYVEQGWKITAMKVAKGSAAKEKKEVGASALRMSFKTDRPLFPYREPDPKNAAAALKTSHRLLRIYFIADARYRGELTRENPWTGNVAWSGPLGEAVRVELLRRLKLPESTGPGKWWLTEFEDNWPYRAAPADVYFSRDATQDRVKRPPVTRYVRATWPTDASGYALAAALVLPPLWRRVRRGRKK
jgi:hypothetical protein